MLPLLPIVALLLAAAPAAAESISGVCPDGSIFIVQSSDAIPCRNAKRVEPGQMPPLQPEYLPRPYGWEVFNRQTDPYNPYNVVDTVRPDAAPPPPVSTAPPAPESAPESPRQTPPTLALAPHELDDLAAIIDVLQDRAPAKLVGPGLEVRLGRSAAFEARVSELLAGRGAAAGGPVIAFHALAHEPSAFWGNLTFVQGHVAFIPDTSDTAQFGLVDGSLGPLQPGQRLLGYVVLPAHADPSQPLDVYWNDRRLTAVFNP